MLVRSCSRASVISSARISSDWTASSTSRPASLMRCQPISEIADSRSTCSSVSCGAIRFSSSGTSSSVRAAASRCSSVLVMPPTTAS